VALIDDLVINYVRHAGDDYVGLWMIVARLREQHGVSDRAALMDAALAVVRGLMARGVWPGGYTRAGFAFWPPDEAAAEARIRREWAALGHDPDLAEPICWLGRR
jgi:hypothetical protein